MYLLNQGWPTQIGLWAAFGKISKSTDFLGQLLTKTVKNTQNIEKSLSFNSRLGRKNSFLGRMRPAGRGLATTVFNFRKFRANLKTIEQPSVCNNQIGNAVKIVRNLEIYI
jgi:hypothetical protein